MGVWFFVQRTNLLPWLQSQLTFFDGAVMVTAGGCLCTSVYIAYVEGAGVAMFNGVSVLLLVKVTPLVNMFLQQGNSCLCCKQDFIYLN